MAAGDESEYGSHNDCHTSLVSGRVTSGPRAFLNVMVDSSQSISGDMSKTQIEFDSIDPHSEQNGCLTLNSDGTVTVEGSGLYVVQAHLLSVSLSAGGEWVFRIEQTGNDEQVLGWEYPSSGERAQLGGATTIEFAGGNQIDTVVSQDSGGSENLETSRKSHLWTLQVRRIVSIDNY